MPNLEVYNYAALLDQSSFPWDSETTHRWVQRENKSLTNTTCKDVLISICFGLKPQLSTLLSLPHLFKLYHLCVAKRNWLYLPKRDVSFASLNCWMPQYSWPTWEKYGMYNLESLYDGTMVKTFADISKQHDIPNSVFFQYLQIWHVLNSLVWPPKLDEDLHRNRSNSQGESKCIRECHMSAQPFKYCT